MFRKFSLLILSFIVPLLFSACGGGGGSSDPTPTNSAPQFVNLSSSINIDENQTSVIDLNASDADNDTLTFSIDGTNTENFNIDSSTGLITFKTAPDYETKSSYSITVKVSDETDTTSQTLKININDLNENIAPQFVSLSSSITVEENQTSLVNVNANDADSDTLTYSIEGADAGELYINSSTGLITFKTAPDYETKSSYSITVKVSDGTDIISQLLTISISDVLEVTNNAPQFINFENLINVNENQTSVVDLDAIDSDPNTTLTFSIEGTDANEFNIDSSSGVITFKTSPDFETKSSYSLTVKVSDGIDTTSQALTININDVDETPVVKTVKITGKAIDGYIKGATVFIDLNKNGILDEGEPTTTTADDGSYTFDIDVSKLTSKPSIIVFGGIDDSTGEEFTGELSSIVEETSEDTEVNITPITTVLDELVDDASNQTAIEQAKEKVANTFNLDKEDLNKDPIAEFTNNPEIYKQSLIIVKTIEVLNAKEEKEQNKENFKEAIKAITSIVEEDTKMEETDTITLSGKVVTVADELDLIDAEVDKIETVPTDGKGYGDVLDNANNKEIIENLAKKSNQEKVDLSKQIINEFSIRGANVSLSAVIQDLNLNINPYRTNVTWESSNTEVLSNDGQITRPEVGSAAVSLTLTVTISKGEDENKAETTKTFDITVLPLEISDSDAVALVKNNITFDSIKENNESQTNITTNLSLVTEGNYGVKVIWTSSNLNALTNSGIVSRPSIDEENLSVKLTATITKSSASVIKEFDLIISKIPLPDTVAVLRASDDLDINDILNENIQADSILSNLILPSTGLYTTDISWNISDEKVVSSSGVITKPDNETGNVEITLTATISKGESSTTKEFTITVLAISDEEVLNNIYPNLTFEKIKALNQNENLIISDLELIDSLEKATISWSSDNETIIGLDGKVTRPDIANQEEDKSVTITATLTYKSASKDIEFELLVKAYDSSLVDALQKDTDSLTFELIKEDNIDTTKIATNLLLPSKGINDTTITWSSSNEEVITNMGVVTRPNYELDNQNVTLTATFSNDSGTQTKEFELTVLSTLQVDTTLELKQETGVRQSFRSNGVSYIIEVYSNLIRQDELLSGNANTFKLDVKVNGKNIDTLELPIEYKNQKVKVSIYSLTDGMLEVIKIMSEKEVILNQSSITLDDINFEDDNSLKLPSFKRTDTQMPPMVSNF